MLTRFKCCCCWLLLAFAGSPSGIKNRSRIQLRDHHDVNCFFFFFLSGFGPLGSAALDGQGNGQGFATLGDTEAARIFGDPLTGGMGFSGAAARPAGCCAGAGAPPPDVEPGEQRKQLGFGTPKVPKSTHACPRQEPAPGFPTRPRQRQRQHGVGSAGKSRRLNSQASQHRMS